MKPQSQTLTEELLGDSIVSDTPYLGKLEPKPPDKRRTNTDASQSSQTPLVQLPTAPEHTLTRAGFSRSLVGSSSGSPPSRRHSRVVAHAITLILNDIVAVEASTDLRGHGSRYAP